ncbi:MarR family transcriptional regulator [Mucilaginibacter sp. Bleaf8]|uniref:MarR family winged helix-turn-helix transcriptional regulator n=1 Tax=Mucilaginibacter sp. Bleaf8 TaxID=2834430 RepID=UPI001BD02597|nr:MarR family transcriptional regulator [Mucilaginibacter sp. Bleaf8]MBS7563619.1 MarR family transcriptional regulator [Mucilaginibacter sp. Bleaf8]
MQIDKEIQSKFEDNYHKAVVNVNYTYGWLANLLRSEFEKYNLTSQQFNVLRILRGQHPKPATINMLKERMLDKMSDASRIVDRLVQKELVSRGTCSRDRRAVDIKITDKGLDILTQMDKGFKTADLISRNLTEDEAGLLSDLLDKLRG